MHASSFIALALGATAVSAAAQKSCDPACQFPKSLDCPVRGGVHIDQKDLIDAVKAGDRSQPPRETSAANLATKYCSGLKTYPLWVTGLPNNAGSVYYAVSPSGTFYYCGTTSGRHPSGWPDQCKENF
ncbi:hypothetical protein COCVIDRAFT_105523 [Bipolaris victoriae FI3]|uniref:Uncharacterized protein n=1 Tax=Bipolaris victoriae (strain FI3) TaxID=930091 RepID=W7EG33_BIPV3|nr:hypothetical protein COCVIDRAFT_105523 [Bipolaris victoriae FI3]